MHISRRTEAPSLDQKSDVYPRWVKLFVNMISHGDLRPDIAYHTMCQCDAVFTNRLSGSISHPRPWDQEPSGQKSLNESFLQKFPADSYPRVWQPPSPRTSRSRKPTHKVPCIGRTSRELASGIYPPVGNSPPCRSSMQKVFFSPVRPTTRGQCSVATQAPFSQENGFLQKKSLTHELLPTILTTGGGLYQSSIHAAMLAEWALPVKCANGIKIFQECFAEARSSHIPPTK